MCVTFCQTFSAALELGALSFHHKPEELDILWWPFFYIISGKKQQRYGCLISHLWKHFNKEAIAALGLYLLIEILPAIGF